MARTPRSASLVRSYGAYTRMTALAQEKPHAVSHWHRHIPSICMKDTPHGEHRPYDTSSLLAGLIHQQPNSEASGRWIRVDARSIVDPVDGEILDATLILEHTLDRTMIRFAGPTADLPIEFVSLDCPHLTLHDHVILPALVNAHTHLDLSHIGPRPHTPGEGFVSWVDMIRANRAVEDDEIAACTRIGIQKSINGGVIAVGDIAGAPQGRLCTAPAMTLADSPLSGVSYLEYFGIGKTAASTVRRLSEFLRSHAPALCEALHPKSVRLGLQPHATNTIDLGVYQWSARAAQALGLPVSTHLAETPEEHEFIEHGTGDQRAMLERFGVWDKSVLDHVGKGKSPIEHLIDVLATQNFLAAHVNDADDRGIEVLQSTGTHVAYCPRASAYFGAADHFGPHRYRDMLDAGVNVCLGTDSIVNLDTPDRISVLDDMRHLYQSGDRDTQSLLAMGTINGAKALGLDADQFRIRSNQQTRGLVAVHIQSQSSINPWSQVLQQENAPSWLLLE